MSRIEKYIRVSSIEEALAIKGTMGPKAFYLAGGTDALVHCLPGATTAIDIMSLEMDAVSQVNGSITIGATAILRDLERHPAITAVAGGALTETIRETAPWLIRNAGTLVGNICNASPSADSAPMLLALDASVMLSDGRAIPLTELFIGPHKTVLGDDLVTELRIEPRDRKGLFHKLSRSKSDIAQVNLAVTGRLEGGCLYDVRIACGSVAPTPMRAVRSEQLLEGNQVTTELLDQLRDMVRSEIRPIDDWRATAEYRRHAAGIMAVRAVRSLVAA